MHVCVCVCDRLNMCVEMCVRDEEDEREDDKVEEKLDTEKRRRG